MFTLNREAHLRSTIVRLLMLYSVLHRFCVPLSAAVCVVLCYVCCRVRLLKSLFSNIMCIMNNNERAPSRLRARAYSRRVPSWSLIGSVPFDHHPSPCSTRYTYRGCTQSCLSSAGHPERPTRTYRLRSALVPGPPPLPPPSRAICSVLVETSAFVDLLRRHGVALELENAVSE